MPSRGQIAMKQQLVAALAVLLMLVGSAMHGPARAGAAAEKPGLVALAGIAEGPIRLIRQSSRITLVEGLALQAEDIVETAAGAFVQIELPNGVLLGLGEHSRLMLRPRMPRDASGAAPQAYLLGGWLKISMPGGRSASTLYRLPDVDVWAAAATVVLRLDAPATAETAVFVENGSVKLSPRQSGSAGAVTVQAGQYASTHEATRWSLAPRPPADFISRVPRVFLDTLPVMAERYAGQKIVAKPQAEVSYADVAPWLRAESALRLPLLERWRGRIADRTFRAGIVADLALHPEWERVVYPERFCPRHADGRVISREGCTP